MSKLKLLELFSGIQAQERALRQLPIEYESVGVCDCDKDVLLSAAAMRFNLEDEIKNFNFPSQDKMIEYLQNKNIGYSFEKNKHTITSRTPITKLKQYYISDKLLKNLGDISKIDSLPYADLVTYSSPCQSFSVAGKLAGAKKICKTCGYEWEIDFSNPNYNYKCPYCGSVNLDSTTSGLLQEVQRLLSVAYKNNTLPKYLLLENVKNLVGKKFKPQFDAWIRWLDSIGYNTYYQVLNSKHYGIPQNRERIFAVSIRKDIDDGKFKFPEQIPLTTRLKDILEKNVDEKYYLSSDKVESILANFIARQNEASGINLKDQATTFDGLTDVAHTLMARDYKGFGNQSMTGVIEPNIETVGNYIPSGHEASRVVDANDIAPTVKENHGTVTAIVEPNIIKVGQVSNEGSQSGMVYDTNGLSPTICAGCHGYAIGNILVNDEPFIVASRGRNPENPSDRTTGSPTEQRLEANTSGTTNTITTVAKDNYVMEPVVCEQRCDDGLRFFKDNVVGTLRTIDACGDKRVVEPDDMNPVRIGNIYGEQFGTGYAGNVWDQDSVSPTIMTAQGGNRQPLVVDNVKWRIRKLIPKECWRLMGFSDKDCDHASNYVSDSALYKQAGNSIVTACLVAIFYSLLFKDSSTKWSDYIVQYKINGGN